MGNASAFRIDYRKSLLGGKSLAAVAAIEYGRPQQRGWRSRKPCSMPRMSDLQDDVLYLGL
eukprot:scaffold2430_cov62-Alexandrium_tamarense.AAC.1